MQRERDRERQGAERGGREAEKKRERGRETELSVTRLNAVALDRLFRNKTTRQVGSIFVLIRSRTAIVLVSGDKLQ